MDIISSALGFILAVGVLVTVHEFGHFWVARSLNVKVLKFSIGFGRSLWSWKGKQDNTEYAIAMIPLGGYVRMLDESEGDVAPEEVERAFNRKPLWVRTAVVLAGPGFNFLFAILAYWMIFSVGVDGLKPVVGDVAPDSVAEQSGLRQNDVLLSIDGRTIQTWGEHRLYMMDRLLDGKSIAFEVQHTDGQRQTVELTLPEPVGASISPSIIEAQLGLAPRMPPLGSSVGAVSPDSPASRAGLVAGDRIVAINGTSVKLWDELVREIAPKPGEQLLLEVQRDQTRLELLIQPDPVTVNGKIIGRIGIGPMGEAPGPEYLAQVQLGMFEKISRAVENTWVMSLLTLKMLYRMLKLEVSPRNLSGPITIAHYAGQTVQIGFIPFLSFLAVISISLGVLNLLPIPVLDGGHLLYYLIELIRGGPVSENVMYWGQQLGILMLAGLMGIAFYNDILRLFE